MIATAPVLFLLLFDTILFVFALVRSESKSPRSETILLSALFLCSGMPALIYQIVWQRVLFSIYGVNSQSVVVVVSAFMLGLGLGSLLGGRLSAKFPNHGTFLFACAELGVAVFGLASLRIFRAEHAERRNGPLAARGIPSRESRGLHFLSASREAFAANFQHFANSATAI